MTIVSQEKTINIQPKVSAPVTVHVSQGDTGTEVTLRLLNGDEVYIIPAGIHVTVHGKREDGGVFGPYDCEVYQNSVSFDLTSAMTAVCGSAIAEIVLTDGDGNKVGTANFAILVEDAAFPLGVTYENDVSVYESILQYVIDLGARVDEIISEGSESTEGNEELIDIRVGADGVTYPTAGNSVRSQITNLKAAAIVNSGDIDDLAPRNTPYLLWAGTYTHLPEGLSSPVGILWCNSASNGTKTQVYVNMYTGRLFSRLYRYNTETWDNWANSDSSALTFKSNIAATDDYNDLTEPGIYSSEANRPAANKPPTDLTAGILIVNWDYSHRICYQTFIANYTGTVYTRLYSTVTELWTNWKSNATHPNITGTDDYNNLIESGVYPSATGALADNRPTDNTAGVLYVDWDYSHRICYQTFFETYTATIYTRLYTEPNDSWRPWRSSARGGGDPSGNSASISILFVGNSLTQDVMSWMPYVLASYYPEVDFRFYMWYNGGKTLEDQYGYFVQDKACDIFSVAENTNYWTNYVQSKKMSQILTTYKFDVVCLQEYFNYKESYDDVTDWTNCRDYIESHYTGGNGLEFITLMHAPRTNNLEPVYALERTGCAKILHDTVTQDMIPAGIAKYNALSTPIGTLGDGGDLTPGDYTHAQEGLPCLVQTYSALCWLLEKLSINKSVYGLPFRANTEIYQYINVPGPNLGSGVITGTDEQNLIAQEVAIQAYKEGKVFVAENIADGEDSPVHLGALAYLDQIDYSGTLITNKPVLGTMSAVNDAPSNGAEYVRKNGAWAVASGGGGSVVVDAVWGQVTGTLSDQTDLATALAGKQNTLTIDSTPTSGSSNPVSSGGVYTALQVDDTGWVNITLGSSYDTGSLKYRKVGNIVEISGDELKLKATSSERYEIVGNIPNGYRPSQNTVMAGHLADSGSPYEAYTMNVQVRTNGNMIAYRAKGVVTSISTTQFLRFGGQYFAA